MNLFQAADFYIDKILNSQSKTTVDVVEQSRVKALLLDKNTTSTISMCATQTELLEHEIYLVDTIENQQRDVMRHLKCLVYVKPTDETIDHLLRELQNPKYGEYQIFFNNTVTKSQLERLAECDDLEVVAKVEEVFQDYLIVNEDLFSLDLRSPELFSNQSVWEQEGLEKVTQSIISLLLSLKVKPVIRFESNSKICAKLAKEISYEVDKNSKTLFDFPQMDSQPLLFLLDRKNDPLTPLLQPWTYQSMINEYIGIKRNIVNLSQVPDLDSDLQKVVLSSKQDPFFHDTMYLNFGDLGDKVKAYVSNYKSKTKSNAQLSTIEDIKQFIEKFPEFKKLSGNVSKHMAIVSELDRQLQLRRIWDVSEVEQNVSVHTEHVQDFQDVLKLIQDPLLDSYYKLKLACIYSLRHENSAKLKDIASALEGSTSPEDLNFYHQFTHWFDSRLNKTSTGKDKDDLISELTKKFNTRMGSRHGADNVFMQHMPDLSTLLTELSKNSLPKDKYPTLKQDNTVSPVQDVIIFMVGGVTLEEARVVHQFNETMRHRGNMRVIIGGTTILNTKSFIEDIKSMQGNPTELTDLL